MRTGPNHQMPKLQFTGGGQPAMTFLKAAFVAYTVLKPYNKIMPLNNNLMCQMRTTVWQIIKLICNYSNTLCSGLRDDLTRKARRNAVYYTLFRVGL